MPGVFSSVRSRVGRRVPSPPAAPSRPGGQGRPALPALERIEISCRFPEVFHPHGRAEARPSRSLSTGRDALLRVRERNGCATMEPSGEEPVVSFVQSRGRAASPLAAGNRDVQVDVMGGADARRPDSGGKSVRTFPSTPFDMTDSGGQGLPALPALERFCPFPEVFHPHGRAEERPSRALSTGRDALLRGRRGKGGRRWRQQAARTECSPYHAGCVGGGVTCRGGRWRAA